jgi:hypothetical protein
MSHNISPRGQGDVIYTLEALGDLKFLSPL